MMVPGFVWLAVVLNGKVRIGIAPNPPKKSRRHSRRDIFNPEMGFQKFSRFSSISFNQDPALGFSTNVVAANKVAGLLVKTEFEPKYVSDEGSSQQS